MRFTKNLVASALFSSAVLLGNAVATDEDPAADAGEASVSVEESSSSTTIERPTFTPASIKAPFLEQFTDDWSSRWAPSHAKKELDKNSDKADEEWAYVGEWAVEEPHKYKGIDGDKGLVVKNPAAHHAISAKFPKKIDNKGKTLVVQYEVKLQNGLECGGAYLKLLKENKALHAEEFSNASPYVIMFGPDKCGSTNKVHFIFKHKNPKTGEYEEKHLKAPPTARIVETTSLYTLIVRPDQTVEIKIDGESVKNATLHEDFSPSVNPEKEIEDAKDKKPEDWVDDAKIPDPEATKPEDWDEDAPFEIVDDEAEKPADWLDDEPAVIPDPEAEKPEAWDDEEDGDWVAPTVSNPKCDEVSGCGKWEKPTKKNPEYKGKWSAPLIDNPAYKGVWKPRKIANPAYFNDKTPSNFEPMGAIGFEIWTMQSDILFDNIYIGHSVEDAEKLKAETFDIKHPIEKQEEEASKPPPPKEHKSPSDMVFLEDPVAYVREKLDLFLTIAKTNPVEAIRFVPEVAGGIGVLIVTVLSILIAAFTLGGSTPAPVQKAAKKGKEAAASAKEAAADAASSGVETVKSEAQKRTTRSQASAE